MRLRSTEMSARTIGDETIVLNLTSSRYFTVTGVGTTILALLAEERTLDELVTSVVAEYEVESAVAQRDIERFVTRLRDAQLLH